MSNIKPLPVTTPKELSHLVLLLNYEQLPASQQEIGRMFSQIARHLAESRPQDPITVECVKKLIEARAWAFTALQGAPNLKYE